MIHFRLFNWLFVARVHRIRKVSREELAGSIVCGPNIEERYAAQVDQEIVEYEAYEMMEQAIQDFTTDVRWTARRTEEHVEVPLKIMQALDDKLLDVAVMRRSAASPPSPQEPVS